MPSPSLRELYAAHTGKVSDKWALYLDEYDRLFDSWRDKPVRLLEIGVQNGGSLEIWRRYFPRAQAIVGCDINPDCARLGYGDPRIELVVADACDAAACAGLWENHPEFDIVVDDGSHFSGDIVRAFLLHFPRLAGGGLYVVEDLHCSYWDKFDGGLYDPYSAIAFFKRLVDIVNHEHWGIDKPRAEVLRGLLRHHGCEGDPEEIVAAVQGVAFSNSVCVVRKAGEEANTLGEQIVGGESEIVVPGRKRLHGRAYGLSAYFWQSGNPWSTRPAPPDEMLPETEAALAAAQAGLDAAAQRCTALAAEVAALRASTSWRLTAPLRRLGAALKRLPAAGRFAAGLLRRVGGPRQGVHLLLRVAKREGWSGVAFKARNVLRYWRASGEAPPGPRRYPLPAAEALDPEVVAGGPLITVLMPVFDTPAELLEAAIASVLQQAYGRWELIIVDDRSAAPHVAPMLRRFAALEPRIRLVFRERNGNISSALNAGLDLAAGDYLTVLDHDDLLDPAALWWVARTVLEHPEADYIYSDEDKVSEDGQFCYGPFFKPDWSPEYFLAMMYTCHMSVFRTALVREAGGYRPAFDGAQDYDLTLRVLAKTSKVLHIPRVLYHWRAWEGSTARSLAAKPYAEERARRALAEFLTARGESFEIRPGPLPGHHNVVFLPRSEPLVSIVIPTANGSISVRGVTERHLDGVVASIYQRSRYRNFELIVVHNGNLLPAQEEALARCERLLPVRYEAARFSLSEKINLGARHASGDYLVIMNDDIRVISEDWLDQMLGMAQREGVGVVGAKLLFPDQTIQHAGVVLLGGLPGHAYYQWPRSSDGYALGAKVNRNYLAVTGACAMTPKALFDRVGGYSERYPLNYNDVDYCLKLHCLGYRSIFLANVELYHYEGVSKAGGRSVAVHEINRFVEDWGSLFRHDPYYNPNLSQHAPYQFV